MEVLDIKQLYEAPSIQVVEVKSEGIICASEGEGHGYGGWD